MDFKSQAQELRLKSTVGEPGEGSQATQTRTQYHALKDSLHSQLLIQLQLTVLI